MKHLLRELPSVDQVVRDERLKQLRTKMDQEHLVTSIRNSIDDVRASILEGKYPYSYINVDRIVETVLISLEVTNSVGLKSLINGTGVILHTNLGRAPMAASIREEFNKILFGYCNLEYQIDKGVRGSRHDHLKEIIQRLTGADDVIVVNNNAAAVMLVLSTLCKNREVIVSRGELVEIGGSFRIPKVMEHSGAILKEVGATNKTHINDYEEAINENTSALMKVHTSNFKVTGFTSNVSIKELKPLAEKYELPIIDDLGSGVFVDLRKYNLEYEPTVKDSLEQGSDIVTFSGDKLLGGPQCGIIVGKKKYIDMMKKNNLLRALRVDKLTISALALTFKQYLDSESIEENLPVFAMLSQTEEQLSIKAEALIEKINSRVQAEILTTPISSQVGGGSLPSQYMKSYGLSIKPTNMTINSFEEAMRITEPHIIGRIANEEYLIDVRTVFDNQLDTVAEKINKLLI
ncbi:MAG: L-seryl-tRNA(Sec) selenium transferase [Filifactoraceae bacterium]